MAPPSIGRIRLLIPKLNWNKALAISVTPFSSYAPLYLFCIISAKRGMAGSLLMAYENPMMKKPMMMWVRVSSPGIL
jgi:hypothetical protein